MAEHAVGDGSDDADVFAHSDWLDTAALDRLADDTSSDLVPQMAKILICELHGHAAEIDAAAKSLNIPALAKTSHLVKSSAATFGLSRVQATAEILNAACKAENRDDVRRMAADLLSQIDPSIKALGRRCGIDGITGT